MTALIPILGIVTFVALFVFFAGSYRL